MPNSSDPVNTDQELREQPARAYCRRLVQQIKAFPPRPRLYRADKNQPETEQERDVRIAQERANALIQKDVLRKLWSTAFNLKHPSGAEKPEPPAIETSSEDLLTDLLHADPRAQASLAALVEYPPSKWLLEQELSARGNWPAQGDWTAYQPVKDAIKTKLSDDPNWFASDDIPDVYDVAELCQLKGVCFSGGGIRSATFNLGILQGLAALEKLGSFDYLSTVSGGGYIHQFLASWIYRQDRNRVEKQLQPLPGPPSQRTLWPDPLRWLRRYSNYLTPKVGLFTADTWVAFSIWLRNTFLNQIVLISTILLILLLPHFYVDSKGPIAHFLLRHGEFTAAVILLGFGIASAVIFSELKHPPNDYCQPDEDAGLSQSQILWGVFVPILVAILALCPYLYRASFWGGAQLPHTAAQTEEQKKYWAQVDKIIAKVDWPSDTRIVPPSTRLYLSHLHSLPSPPEPLGFEAKMKRPNPPESTQCCEVKKTNPQEPTEPGALDHLRAWQAAYSFRWWSPKKFNDDISTSRVFSATLIGIALLVLSCIRAIRAGGQRRSIILLGIAGAVGSGFVLIHLSRFAIFAASFFLPLNEVTRVAIPLLPPLGLGIVFLSIEIAGGLIGNLVDESVREWFARLRAYSFLFGIVWFALTASSLLGPALVYYLFHVAYVGKSLWLGWIGTTLVSVLAGKSSLTSGTSTDSKSKLSSFLNFLVLIGPPVFLIGLVLTLAAVVEKVLLTIDSQLGKQILPQGAFFVLFGLLAVTAVLFGWRIDINEFSLHAFYRDRLARCYAGASFPNIPHRNRFTGFAASDKHIRLVDLLPKRFNKPIKKALWAPSCEPTPEEPNQNPTYEGPFPIFCTTLNLTFGEDLAYQERKGAAFAFTPLYCGYDVGWTETDSDRVQFNGYTPTRDFAFDDGGPRIATAVAASGAAVSPNWGYHSSPTMAFLLTIFNVRLGLWIRNPRHKRFRVRPDDNPSSPAFGLFYLLAELFGMVNDEAAFVYLTDGGHFENMGLYELVRRHCSSIVICDAEEDGKLTFGGIGMAIRKCRIDFGAEIDLDISQLELKGTPPASPVHCVEGTVRYPNGAKGDILYIKSAFTNHLPADLINYHKEHPAFPNDSTLNQWFTESQFESYRRLGHHSATTGQAANWLNTL